MYHFVHRLALILVLVAVISVSLVLNTILTANDNEPESTIREAVPTIAETNTNADYILNKNTLKAHTPDCEEVNDISPDNVIYFHGSSETLTETGYSPCYKCKPWRYKE